MSKKSLKKNHTDIARMFDDIAPKYDFLNHFLSFGADKIWRKKISAAMASDKPYKILDVATGTADLALAINAMMPETQITGTDISEKMLKIALDKTKQMNLNTKITFIQCSAEDMPFAECTFDAVSVAFGIRNFQDLKKGIQEMFRVLKPNKKLYILEFSKPSNKIFRPLYMFYLAYILPLAGRGISGNRSAYSYLRDSVRLFQSRSEIKKIIASCGFKSVISKPMSAGIVTLYIAER